MTVLKTLKKIKTFAIKKNPFYNSVAKVLDSLLWKQPIFIQLNYQEKWYDKNYITYTEEKAILWKENKANM